MKTHRALGKDFSPSLKLKTLYYAYFIAIFILAFLWWNMILLALAPLLIYAIISAPLWIILLFTLYWIPKYYRSIIYKLTGDEMTWRRGVWFKKTGIVPYNRITNIDIEQGPVSRALGIASLKIQTAGYSGAAGKATEIKLEGIEDFEELREEIMSHVRGRKPVAVETYGKEERGHAHGDVIGELVKIRKLLEKRK
jgi:membrane protein YdbS with pleckstrin-like domain